MMMDAGAVFVHNPRVEFRNLADEGGVLLHLDTASYHGINEIGALVWDLLEGITFAQLISALRDRLEDVPPAFEAEISEFLADLADRELIIRSPDVVLPS